MNRVFLFLVFLVPLQNIYLGKIPSLGYGINILNILMLIAYLQATSITETSFRSKFNSKIYIVLFIYVMSFFWAAVYLTYDPTTITLLKDIIFPYLFFFIAYKCSSSIKKMKYIFLATVMPLPYMFKVFYTNLSWMGFSTYQDKLRLNNGTFMELGSNEIAAFYAMYTFVILAVAFQETNKKLRWLLFAAVAMNAYSLLYAFSRGAYLSSLIALVVFAFLNGKVRLVVCSLLLILLLSTFGAKVIPTAVVERFDSAFVKEEELDESAKSRSVLWDIALDRFVESPILGVGLGNFRKLNSYGKDTHNYYVKILVESGVVGFVGLTVFLVAAFRQGIKLYLIAKDPFLKALSSGFIACMVAMLIGNFFGDRFTYYPLISYFFVYLAMVVKGIEMSKEGEIDATDVHSSSYK